MSPRHVYKYFRVTELCGRILGVQYIRWNNVKNAIETDYSRWSKLKSVLWLVWLLILCIDAFYCTLKFAVNAEVIYIFEIPCLFSYSIFLFTKLTSIGKQHMETVNRLDFFDKMLFRYYKKNRFKTTEKWFVRLWSFLNVFTMIVALFIYAIHFNYPFCKMYTIQFLLYVYVYVMLINSYITKTVFINRLIVFNDFIMYDVPNEKRQRSCEICNKYTGQLRKTICDQHKIS